MSGLQKATTSKDRDVQRQVTFSRPALISLPSSDDFVPVLGYLDDIIIVPLGIMLVVRMIPAHIMAEHRASAEAASGRPASWSAAVAIVAIWIAAIAVTAWVAWQLVR